MHTNEPRELQGVELGYDPRDIDARGIYRIVIGFFLFTLFFFGLGAAFFISRGWGGRTSFDTRKPAFAGPKLQGNIAAKIDIMTMRQEERKAMESYADLHNGKWRIPVERAMQLTAEQGVPEPTSDQKAVSPGNTIPQNAVGPAGSSTVTSPSESAPGDDRLNGVAGGSTSATPTQAPPKGITPPTPTVGQGSTGNAPGGVSGTSGP